MPNEHERGEDDPVRACASDTSLLAQTHQTRTGTVRPACYTPTRHKPSTTQLSKQDRDEQGPARHTAIYIHPALSYAQALGHPSVFAHPLTRLVTHSAAWEPASPRDQDKPAKSASAACVGGRPSASAMQALALCPLCTKSAPTVRKHAHKPGLSRRHLLNALVLLTHDKQHPLLPILAHYCPACLRARPRTCPPAHACPCTCPLVQYPHTCPAHPPTRLLASSLVVSVSSYSHRFGTNII
ncbi:uncharacterized protein B0H18DRAFT_456460 [Fomitopsis serialis]|uniref:uncharacterized protein n=1 Tax=Fomitopsis serialis TaxID=139415 RepID=UPI002007D4B0|nr:uncharacterized protein B0H18DRAFT_456460 [Neoantrodia serialis]KAH9923605.1 hypothetical protein B0H18DRAFT_456460 [Neoantrodia serialis]